MNIQPTWKIEMPQFSPCGNAKRIYTSRASAKEEK